ncbi:pseudouridine synthase [Staphylococcus epidermidis]|jgi:16S rRNA pseudouridine516 synthase|uniref:Pseudouridine synthase n=7 Tax=root TaxID=1 RepID=A0A4Q9W5D1_STAEP|nr:MULTISPECIES: pseudouridine synthase [Staphylococcus]EHR89065.1 pseudouridylate synthase [Staphylococcus epidermidis VCU123]EID35807.1 pseudouridylate synthase [Staphylococcus epidermidis IS-250]EON82529.1 pseudouridine synthase [Staphylococcus epidermidis 41tr]EON85639.1 pseudouridine synthase [Staphylococcus epidermidis 36-1]MCZ5875750.1 pseudouridine synthase [Escherichia coli]CVY09890.1 pseudouridine synthase rRNA-specific [Streptococcus pneumoniae]SLB94713.1 pseudouridylate synthase 
MRLDKFLANMGVGTRSEVKQLLKKGSVKVNQNIVKLPKLHVNPNSDEIMVNDEVVSYIDKVYIMLNKPKGYISATEDEVHPTIIDLIPEYAHLNIFPVGRLDKDTEGLLLVTNDGQFNHEVMNPNKHVSKTYEVYSKHPITQFDIDKFKSGIELSDGKLKPAILKKVDNYVSHVTIYEGKYHQVKRMFHSIENEVLELKRIKIAQLELDHNLDLGSYRLLTQIDFDNLKN